MSAVDLAVLFIYWLAGIVVLAEALNKLERTDVRQRGATLRQRFVTVLKVLAWVLLAIGGAGAVVTPLLHLCRPAANDVAVVLGFAILIIRTRLKDELL